MGVTPQTINKWAKGTTFPSSAKLEQLAKEVDLPVESLITFSNSMTSVTAARAGRVVALSKALQQNIHKISSDLPGIIERADLSETDSSIIALAVGEMAESANELQHVLSQHLEQLEHDD